MKEAERAGDGDEAMELRRELAQESSFYDRERDRLTERDTGLIAGGATLTAIGGISMVSSIILLAVYGLSAVDGNADDEYGWASLGTLFGGIAGLAGGGAMLGVGLARRPKETAQQWMTPTVGDIAPTPGLTLTWQF
jgi:hypothetical protein